MSKLREGDPMTLVVLPYKRKIGDPNGTKWVPLNIRHMDFNVHNLYFDQ